MAKLVKFKINKSTKWSNINLTVIEDPTLSPKAKYIHTYLMTRPPDWEIRTKDIINKCTSGRNSIYRGLKELEDKKYMYRRRVYENGKIAYWSYDVYEEPTEKPLPENLLPQNLHQENLHLENGDDYYSNTVNNKHSKTVSNETVIPDKSGINENPLRLRIKPRKKTNNNGLLYDSSVAKRYKQIDLNIWNEHPLSKSSRYDPPTIALQEKIKLMRIKRPMVRETKEIVDYWNENASQLSSNGHKLPSHRLDLDTKTSYMCKLIVTGILHTSNLTVEDIKKAIDNYRKVLENSHYYNHLYSFPKFYSKSIFNDCVEGNLDTYIKFKKELSREDLLEVAKREHKLAHDTWPSHLDEGFYKREIHEGRIKTEDDARRSVR